MQINYLLQLKIKLKLLWGIISNQIEFYPVDTCRNVFKKVLNIFNIESIYAKKKDLLLVNKILDLDSEISKILTGNILRQIENLQKNKERIEELIRNFDPFGIKSLRTFY